ncbi:MAG: pantetheine-phosphate adenylyltransferase [Actinomycetota bacterium]
MAKLAVYPGSFDPVTLGHLDIMARAAGLFDVLEVLVVHNPDKKALFSPGQRAELIRESLLESGISLPNLEVKTLESGLLVEYCTKQGAVALIKGFRNNVDLDYELPMAKVNRDLGAIETVFIPADPRFSLVASSLVRQVAALGGPVENYVSDCVAKALGGLS